MIPVPNVDHLISALQLVRDEEDRGGLREFDRDSVFFKTQKGAHVSAREVMGMIGEYKDATHNPGFNDDFRIVGVYAEE